MAEPRAPNPHLAARMNELGISQRELAEHLSRRNNDSSYEPSATDARYIRKLLDGTIRWPHSRQREAIEVLLDTSSIALGFIPPRTASLARESEQRKAGTRREDKRPVIRREFLRVVGTTVVSVAMPAVPMSRSITMKDLREMSTGLTLMHELDDKYGGGAVVQLATASAHHIQQAVERSRLPARVEASLYSLAGTYTSTAGWFAYDAGRHDVAREHFDRALQLALISKDSMVQAQTWNYMGHQARGLGRVNEASAIARAGLDSSTARRDPKIAALFHARLALRYADLGERGLAQRSLGFAEDALSRDDGRERPPWIGFLDAAELAGLSAIAYLRLGQYKFAEQRARKALSALPATHTRNRIGYTVDLAEAQLGYRDVDSACATAHEALSLAESSQSARSAKRLESFRTRVGVWSTTASREWLDRYSTFIGGAK